MRFVTACALTASRHPRPDSLSARVQGCVQLTHARVPVRVFDLWPPAARRPPAKSERSEHSSADVALLAFARCLRSHGFPSFPDPTARGQLSREMLARAGIDLHEPAVVRAADTCTSVTHGVITRAVVARFVAGH